ncbi:RAB7A-interacting MON1-CCZ1 complex subunit 1 isoform X2 [Rhineura floridana]|uniref:RAB7A-interacting MON1-CCZ1 complex subunit 1 isoform X2 n=1 Tax=Rhineura floridana TaxID=261503 RepID=UPI002AC7E934|nr:RAB7A-interacting MON1-CCZ1 complex subunit 1 isoform X2 [Rhineura floridana]
MAEPSFVGELQQPLAKLKGRLQRLTEEGDPSDAFLSQASAILESLTDICNKPEEDCMPSKPLQLYTQAVLDVTYFEENQLVDEDFPEESSLQKVEELINTLSEPEALINERGTTEEFLNEGIYYLMKMLEFRCSSNPSEEFSSRDTDAARLIHEGVFSDTHLLAMMYCGEMCYWGLKYCGEEKEGGQSTMAGPSREQPGSPRNKAPDFREMGEKMLLKYITVCKGALQLHDWDTKHAKLILDYFKQLSI